MNIRILKLKKILEQLTIFLSDKTHRRKEIEIEVVIIGSKQFLSMIKLFLLEGQMKTKKGGFDQWLLASILNLLLVSNSNYMLSMLITLQLIDHSKLLKIWLIMQNFMQLIPIPSSVISDVLFKLFRIFNRTHDIC